jgi:beta-galactosidase
MNYKLKSDIRFKWITNIFLLFLFLGSIQLSYAQLEQTALDKITQLNTLITQAENDGIDVIKEKMTVRVAEVFLGWADWDASNVSINTDLYALVNRYKDNAAQMAANLPNFERNEVIVMLDEAITNIKLLQSGAIKRKNIPVIDWSKIDIDGGKLIHEGRPVFIADYTWKPKSTTNDEFFGGLDGVFMTPADLLDDQGNLKSRLTNEISTLNADPDAGFGTVFLNHKSPPQWAKDKYGDFLLGGTLYTEYDIDNPGAREMQGLLLKGSAPLMKDKQYAKLGYLLTNEPHWNTVADTWEAHAVSEFTKTKFKTWLTTKHGSIANLNSLWNTSFASFNDVTIQIPMQESLHGTPIWCDWMRFNMFRVTEWFTFLTDEIHKHDALANTHIKVIPGMWSGNKRDHGLDFEALTKLTSVIGNDAGARNSYMWGGPEDWEVYYSFEWREMAMSYDFFRSVSPNNVNYNSEGHYLSTGRFRDLELKPSYARAVYWLAFIQGMDAIQTWFWPRLLDGSIRNSSDNKAYAGSLIQQPRIVNEITSTVMDINAHSEEINALQNINQDIRIFHSKTSAINKTTHMDDVFELYESLYFEGLSIGFSTEDIINTQNNNQWEVILVHKTEFVTVEELNALQAYLNNGGTVIVDAVSLKKNEYGQNHTISLSAGSGILQTATSLNDMKTKALSVIATRNKMPLIVLSEINALNKKGCTWRSYKDTSGRHIMSIVNIGKGDAQVALSFRDNADEAASVNLLTEEPLGDTFTMKPDDVLLVELAKKNNGDGTLSVETTSETCPDKDNGKVKITAESSGNYTAVFNNGASINFNSETIIEDIAPGTYNLCVTDITTSIESCYSLQIAEGVVVSGKSSLGKDKVDISIEKGTAPYNVYVNGEQLFQTSSSSFMVTAGYGDVVEVKTDKTCEGIFSTIVGANLMANPNPTGSLVNILMPVGVHKVCVELYDAYSQLISSKNYDVLDGGIQLDITNKAIGVYVAIVQLDSPVAVKIIKK